MSLVIINNNFTGTLDAPDLTQNQNFNLPDASGNIVVDSQLSPVALSGSYNDLTDKPDIPASQSGYVTQTWRDGNNWYRVWSDGWIEQGGKSGGKTITLNKPFTTTNYTAVGNGVLNTDASSYDTFFIKSLSTTRIYASQANTSTNYWLAFGY